LIHPSMDSLLEKADNRFALCIILGKRARQLTEGAHALVSGPYYNAITTAANEANQNKLTSINPKYEKK
jgi:DNA-directed RNA polymerase subunit omega